MKGFLEPWFSGFHPHRRTFSTDGVKNLGASPSSLTIKFEDGAARADFRGWGVMNGKPAEPPTLLGCSCRTRGVLPGAHPAALRGDAMLALLATQNLDFQN